MKINELLQTEIYKLIQEKEIIWLLFCPNYSNPQRIIAVEHLDSFDNMSFSVNTNFEITAIFF